MSYAIEAIKGKRMQEPYELTTVSSRWTLSKLTAKLWHIVRKYVNMAHICTDLTLNLSFSLVKPFGGLKMPSLHQCEPLKATNTTPPDQFAYMKELIHNQATRFVEHKGHLSMMKST